MKHCVAARKFIADANNWGAAPDVVAQTLLPLLKKIEINSLIFLFSWCIIIEYLYAGTVLKYTYILLSTN